MRTIVFYRTSSGKCPVDDFLDALPPKAAQKVTWALNLVEELQVVPSVYFKKLVGTDGIYECRISFAANAYRALCFFSGSDEVVLTHGFVKKTQKTPRAEIEKAQAYRKDLLKRRKEK